MLSLALLKKELELSKLQASIAKASKLKFYLKFKCNPSTVIFMQFQKKGNVFV